MAELTAQPIRLLGFAPIEGITTLVMTLAAMPGPALTIFHGEDIAAVTQIEAATPLFRLAKQSLLDSLSALHRRIEVACQMGPFLAADPAAACCPDQDFSRLMGPVWQAARTALEEYGIYKQWDVVLHWTPQSVIAAHRNKLAEVASAGAPADLAAAIAQVMQTVRAHREHLMRQALAGAAKALAPAGPVGTETEIAMTVLLARDGEAAIEDALGRIPDECVIDAEVDLRGPMPPVSFHAVRLLRAEQGDIARSWQLLNLPERADTDVLHRQWRAMAAAAHPDRMRGEVSDPGRGVAELTDAYRVLRPLLSAEPQTLRRLLRLPAYRLDLPQPSRQTLAGPVS